MPIGPVIDSVFELTWNRSGSDGLYAQWLCVPICYILYHRLNSVSVSVTFCTTDSTLSLSLFEMLHRRIVDHHHYQLYTPFAQLDNSHTGPGPPAHYYMQKHLYPIFGTSHVNRLRSTHVYLFSILEYSHAWSKYHMFSFPCHMFVLLFHMLLPSLPHACCPLLPLMFQFFSI